MADVSKNLQMCILGLLVLQNATQTLLMRYSRGVLEESYNPTVAVILTECSKFAVCVLLIVSNLGESGLPDNKYPSIMHKIMYLLRHSGYTWVPSTCYFIQNSLQYTASENLSSSVYAVLQQMKILSAALASVCILRKQLMWRQWRALLLLVSGGVLMEYHTFSLQDEGSLSNKNDPVKGTVAILTIISLSGFAGVMTELLLKNKPMSSSASRDDQPKLSIWDRNIQLSFYGILSGFVSMLIDRSWMTQANGPFAGISSVTVLLIAIWTCGGLLVAMTIKYTDVIIKGFASAISMIVICFAGYLLLGDYLDILYLIGATVTILATFNYNDKELAINGTLPKAKASPMQNIEDETENICLNISAIEKTEIQPLKDTKQ
eukprot:CAMPEP_0197033522 /NCGR_PEP_ID=MMETSP1384-20130603/11906_1 /TAXON_ID=29189 /ORGANISM="Ammonia sp." /LENGTH=376 /DNA_ID=CAMNT_0042463337 /DNA_START=35 /DNA_END=1165 /DNA_ORIENTATION=-